MKRHAKIGRAYRALGKSAAFYDGIVTCSTLSGKLICKAVWNMGQAASQQYLEKALAAIPADFSGRMLEVPVGTGILTMPFYQTQPLAEAICLDYSADMMEAARQRAAGLPNVRFQQGDVGALPFAAESFDLVLSLNGFHAFPDKDAAYQEIFRVLRPGGIFCGCFYVKGENRRTDWFIDKIYTPKGYFTPPYETADSLRKRLAGQYRHAVVETVESMACFSAVKEG